MLNKLVIKFCRYFPPWNYCTCECIFFHRIVFFINFQCGFLNRSLYFYQVLMDTNMVSLQRLSSKINFDVLENMFETSVCISLIKLQWIYILVSFNACPYEFINNHINECLTNCWRIDWMVLSSFLMFGRTVFLVLHRTHWLRDLG